jgi:hypothetical protein
MVAVISPDPMSVMIPNPCLIFPSLIIDTNPAHTPANIPLTSLI